MSAVSRAKVVVCFCCRVPWQVEQRRLEMEEKDEKRRAEQEAKQARERGGGRGASERASEQGSERKW